MFVFLKQISNATTDSYSKIARAGLSIFDLCSLNDVTGMSYIVKAALAARAGIILVLP